MSADNRSPRVFLSHASEDKQRFVMSFAEQLRTCGVDVWLDHWEMLPGDSLVDKIFNEGLKSADAVIVVLSQFSISKPWVVEELNASIVARISKGLKIIPVVIDNCDVPEALRSTVWEKIDNIECPTAAIERVVAAVYDYRGKPPLGPAPTYVTDDTIAVSGLNRIDTLIFKTSCEALADPDLYLIEPNDLFGKGAAQAVPGTELRDGLEVLENSGLIKIHHTCGPQLDAFEVTRHGWETYLRHYVADYPRLQRDIVLLMLNDGIRDSGEMASRLGRPQAHIDHVIVLLESAGHIMVSKALGRTRHVVDLRGSLKRLVTR